MACDDANTTHAHIYIYIVDKRTYTSIICMCKVNGDAVNDDVDEDMVSVRMKIKRGIKDEEIINGKLIMSYLFVN